MCQNDLLLRKRLISLRHREWRSMGRFEAWGFHWRRAKVPDSPSRAGFPEFQTLQAMPQSPPKEMEKRPNSDFSDKTGVR
jgi:hypothetical protein